MAAYLYDVTVPPKPDNDPGVTRWEISPSFDGNPGTVLSGDTFGQPFEFLVPQNPGGGSPQVSLSLVFIDGAGNVSPATSVGWSEPDTVPPAAPGELGVTFKGIVE